MKPDVQDVIPQRYPFQMIDKFVDVKPGESASAVKLISINEWFFANKQADNLVVPRPIMIESMAQTGVAAILSMPEYQARMPFFWWHQKCNFPR